MLKKLLLGTALFSFSVAAAFAADLPSRRAPPIYVAPVVPVFSWSGLYLGGNAGYSFDNKTTYRLNGPAAGNFPAYAQSKDNGFTGGLQIGYNYELGNGFGLPALGNLGGGGLVAGVEADAAYTDLKTNNGVGGAAFRSRTDYVGTARGRLGIAFANALLYGTGGFAYGGVRNGITIGAISGGTDRIRTGYAYGGGVEYAIPTTSFVNFFNAGAVTLKVEYIHYDLGTDTIGLNGGAGGYTARIKNDGNLVRAGINYKMNFLGAPAPVVARY